MPSSKKYLIGCLIFPLLVALAFFIGYRSVSKSMPATKIIPDGSWLVISPTGIIPEYSEIRQTNIFNLSTDSVEEICAKILAAKEDRKIKGLILRPRFAQISYAGISELGDAITDFKSSGKRVIAFGDMIGQRDYMISTLADEIYMEPSASAGIMLEGVNASITFYKEMFDKLGIKMHVLQTGDFKGFGEPFSQTSLSPGTLENYKKALGKRYDLIISFIANNRNLANAAVKSIFEERPDYFLSSQQALDAKLVDGLVGREKLFSTLGISEKQMISLSGYQSSYATPGKKDKIAVVYLEGSIAPAVERAYGYNTNINAAKVQRVIDAIDKDKSIKAVVLRINSGGGSALESELIYQKLDILKARVPVVVSMGGAAASGGYYISCSSDYIVADEFTITGSIGVVMLIPEAEVLSRKIGIKNQHITFGKFASSYDVISKTDPEFLASLKRNSDAVYTEFKSRVEASREMEPGHLESIAQGQIWSAEAALENGLIDSIGTLQTAIAKAASLSGVVSYRRVNLPAKISWIEAFSGLSSSRISSLKSLVDFHANPANIKNLLRDQFPTLEWLYQTPMEVN